MIEIAEIIVQSSNRRQYKMVATFTLDFVAKVKIM